MSHFISTLIFLGDSSANIHFQGCRCTYSCRELIAGCEMRQKLSPTAILSNEQMAYYLMTGEEVLTEIKKTTREVNEILGLPSTTLVRLILNYFQWDKDKLMGMKILLSFPKFIRSI